MVPARRGRRATRIQMARRRRVGRACCLSGGHGIPCTLSLDPPVQRPICGTGSRRMTWRNRTATDMAPRTLRPLTSRRRGSRARRSQRRAPGHPSLRRPLHRRPRRLPWPRRTAPLARNPPGRPVARSGSFAPRPSAGRARRSPTPIRSTRRQEIWFRSAARSSIRSTTTRNWPGFRWSWSSSRSGSRTAG